MALSFLAQMSFAKGDHARALVLYGEALELTVRSYKPEVRKHLLAAIERVAKGEAVAGGAPRAPLVKVEPAANATYNDPELTKRLASALRNTLGQANVVEIPPKMVFEDFWLCNGHPRHPVDVL